MATETIKLKDPVEEAEQAQLVARRYCCDFVDLKTTKIDHELFRTIPVDLMFRYHFVPLQANNGS
ncbi:MAG TPA: pilus assembly protein PilB, partial [Terriglobia bacterium]|nr:pilus assembly protein PilB [Terriglobia bacterium]